MQANRRSALNGSSETPRCCDAQSGGTAYSGQKDRLAVGSRFYTQAVHIAYHTTTHTRANQVPWQPEAHVCI